MDLPIRAFIFSFLAHFIEAYLRLGGEFRGEFLQIVGFIGVPWLIFALFTVPNSFSVLFVGSFFSDRANYCDKCNHGSKDLYVMTSSSSQNVRVGTETTTTTYGDGRQTKSSRGIFKRFSSATYTCPVCGDSFVTGSH